MRLFHRIRSIAERLRNRPGAVLGFVAGVAVPLMLAGLVIVSFRGYGIMDESPQGPQVYTNF
jgi:hypothetical protein